MGVNWVLNKSRYISIIREKPPENEKSQETGKIRLHQERTAVPPRMHGPASPTTGRGGPHG